MKKIALMTTLGICGMIWGVAKIAAAHQKIGANDWWLYLFIGLGVVGCCLMIFAAYRALTDTT